MVVRRGVGSILTDRLRRWHHVARCSACQRLARAMDDLGPDWCEHNAEAIVDRMLVNAAKLSSTAATLFTDLPIAWRRKWLRRQLAKAIKAATCN